MSRPRKPARGSAKAGGTHPPDPTANMAQNLDAGSIFTTSVGPGIEPHPTGGEREKSHGTDYAMKLLMLWLHRLSTVDQDYWISIEDSRAGKFDDFHLQLRREDGAWVQYFIQIKHADHKDAVLELKDLLPDPKSKSTFDLRMYFNSYLQVQKGPHFDLPSERKYILFTNRNVKYGGSIGNFKFSSNVFEVVRDDDIFKTTFLKFKSKFEAREKLVEELCRDIPRGELKDAMQNCETFLDQFYLAVGQYHVTDLEKIIKDEMQQNFGTETENAYSRLVRGVHDWFSLKENKKGTRLHGVRIQEYFDLLKKPIQNRNFHCMDPIPSFHGREDCVEKMFKSLSDPKSDTTPKIDIVISGMGGMGKSELARLYAKKYREKYDHTIWINSETEQNLQQSFTELYTFLELTEDPKSPVPLDKKIRTIYTSLEKKSCLLIFDNAENDETDKNNETLRKFMPELKSVKHDIVFTSQFSDWEDCGLQIPLEVFPETESVHFLENNLQANFYVAKTELVELAKMLGYLPLALQNAVQLLIGQDVRNKKLGKSGNLSTSLVQELIEKLKNRSEDCEKFLKSHYKSGMHSPYTKTIMQLVELSLDGIWNSELENRNEAMKLFFSLAYLQPDNISVDMLYHHPVISSKEQVDEIIMFLDNRSLIKAQGGVISIHRLYQDALMILLNHVDIDNYKCHELVRNILSNHKIEHNAYHWRLQYSSIKHETFEYLCINEKQAQEMFFPFTHTAEGVSIESLLSTERSEIKQEEMPENSGRIPGKLALELTRVMIEISAVYNTKSGFDQHYMQILEHAERMKLMDENYIIHAVYFCMSLTTGHVGSIEMCEQFLILVDRISRDLFSEDSLQYHILILMVLLVRKDYPTYTDIYENGRIIDFEDQSFNLFFAKCLEYARKVEPRNTILMLLIQQFYQKHITLHSEKQRIVGDSPFSIESFLNNDQKEFVNKLLCVPLKLNNLLRNLLEECIIELPKSTIKFLKNIQPDFMSKCQNDTYLKCICFDTVFILCKWYLSHSIYCKTEQILLSSIEHEREHKLNSESSISQSIALLCILHNKMFSERIALEKSISDIEKEVKITKRTFDSFKLHFSHAEILESAGDFSSAKTEYVNTIKCILRCHKNMNHKLQCNCVLYYDMKSIFDPHPNSHPTDFDSCLYRAIKMCFLETKSYEQCCELLDELFQEYKKQMGKYYVKNHILLIRALILEEAEMYDQANLAWIECFQYFEDDKIPYYLSYQHWKFIWYKISQRLETFSEIFLKKFETVILYEVQRTSKPQEGFHIFQKYTFLAIKILLSLKKYEIVLNLLENFENYELSSEYEIDCRINLKPRIAQYRAEISYKMENMASAEFLFEQFLVEKNKTLTFAERNMEPIKLLEKIIVVNKLNFYHIKKSTIQVYVKDKKFQEAILEIDNLLKYYQKYLEMDSNFIQGKLKSYILYKIELECEIHHFEQALNIWKEHQEVFSKCKKGEKVFDSNYCESLLEIFQNLIKANEWDLTQQCIDIWEREKFDKNDLENLQQCISFYEKTGNLKKSGEIFEKFCQLLLEYYLDRFGYYFGTNFNYKRATENLKTQIYDRIISRKWKKSRFILIYCPENRITELEILFCIAFCYYKLGEKSEALKYVDQIEKILIHKKGKDCADLEDISENVTRLKSLCLGLADELSSKPSQSLVPVESSCKYPKCRCIMLSGELQESESDESSESDGNASELEEKVEESDEDESESESDVEETVDSEFKDTEDGLSDSDTSLLTDLEDLEDYPQDPLVEIIWKNLIWKLES